jgi:hypothetical protein
VDFRIDQRFPVPRPVVEAAFTDEQFIASLGELPTIGSPTPLERREEGDTIVMRVRYQFTGNLSSAVRRIIDPSRLTWVEESVFRPAAHHASIRILPDHYADLLKCSMEADFDEDPDGTARRVVGTMKVRMPVVGGKVERAIVSGLQEHARLEVDVLTRWAQKSTG